MASIPLPALDLKTPQQPGPLDDVSKLMALRSMMTNQQSQQQELQIRQQQLKDQQATTAAMRNWDGKDYNALAKGVLDNGGSATAAQGVQQHGLTVQKTVSDIAAQDAATGSKNLETFIGRQKALGDGLAEEKDVPDDQLHDWALGKIQTFAEGGILDPQHAQQAVQGVSQITDPKGLRDHIQAMAKSALGAKAKADQAKTEAEAAKDTAQAGEATATADQKRTESAWYQAHGGAPGVPIEAQQQSDWLSKNPGKTPSDYVVWKAKNSPTILAQGGLGGTAAGDPMVDMVGQGRVDLATATQRMAPVAKESFMRALNEKYPSYNQGTFGIEKKATETATSGAVGQQLLAIGTAREHMKTFRQLADALDNNDVQALNKIGNFLGVQFGSDKTTNFNIASQAFGGEVGKAFDGAGVVAGEREQAQKNFSAAMSKGQFRGAIDTVDQLLAGKQKAAHDWFDKASQAKPDFGSASQGGNDQKKDFFSQFGGQAKQ